MARNRSRPDDAGPDDAGAAPAISAAGAEPHEPANEDRLRLLHGPYTPPVAQFGRPVTCMFRGKAKVCGWAEGPIPWPIIRVGHGGKGAYLMTPELARAVRSESAAAIAYWWGVSLITVCNWRRRLGVEQFNEGTRRLYSLWKEPKLPDVSLTISKPALRRKRLAKGLTQRQVATALGWNSVNTYGQMESGDRQRATPATLERLAKALECSAKELLELADVKAKGRAQETRSCLVCSVQQHGLRLQAIVDRL